MSFELPSADSFAGYPAVRRSRGFRVYSPEGRRFLDLYQDAGRGMMGSRPQGLILRFKSSLEKLGPAAMPSVWTQRAARLLTGFFPDHPWVGIFPSFPEALKALEPVYGGGLPPLWDPVEAGYGRHLPENNVALSIWRPFLPVPCSDVLLPILPGTGTWGGVFVLSRKSLNVPAPPLSPFLLAPQVYGIRLFFRWLHETDPDTYANFPRGPWERLGPYLFPRCREDEHTELVKELIARGLYPSPEYFIPSIIPGDYDEGEIKQLREWEGKWNSA
ncbi:hypothetical protein [Marispirochaeta sp.]|uniref:hypothetical protein n=1 Tax=Marispirochaeta sp. TaxID=2038653 RepID=UPI0029C791C9|nr:hypothetical protein [Marispirochaeta sp.]